MVGKGSVSMGPELDVLVAAVGLGMALSGAVGDVGGESKSTDDSVGDMLACWIVGWVVESDAGMVDVMGDGGRGRPHGWTACVGWSEDLSVMKEERCWSSWAASVML